MARKYQNGSAAHIALVIVVVVALLGVLGYVFWQNYMDKKDTQKTDTTTQTETKPSEPATKTVTMNMAIKPGVSFSYPETWSAEMKHIGSVENPTAGPVGEKYTLTSPDKKYELVVDLAAGGGVGGTCAPTAGDEITVFQQKEIGIKQASVIQAVYKNPALQTNPWQVANILYRQNETTQAPGVGASLCTLGLGVIETSSKLNDMTAMLYVDVNNKTNPEESNQQLQFATEAEAKAFMNSQTGKDIYAILSSLKE